MIIKRNPSIEEWLFSEIRTNWGKSDDRSEGIHLSDLLSPRKAYWQRVKPLPPTDLEIQYWLTGKGHEGVLSRASGYDHAEEREWEGIYYTPDFFHTFPAELKTRRRNLAEDGKEAEVYDYYLKQLLGYCAIENKTHGWLHVWCLVQPQSDGTTKPETRCYEVDFTPEELATERDRLLLERKKLLKALSEKDPHPLPLCAAWMCGKSSKTMTKKPLCSCGREFATEWGANKHLSSKTGEGHDMQPAIYSTDYVKSCQWFDDCKPLGEV